MTTEYAVTKRCLKGQQIEPQGSRAGATWRATAFLLPLAVIAVTVAAAELVVIVAKALQ